GPGDLFELSGLVLLLCDLAVPGSFPILRKLRVLVGIVERLIRERRNKKVCGQVLCSVGDRFIQGKQPVGRAGTTVAHLGNELTVIRRQLDAPSGLEVGDLLLGEYRRKAETVFLRAEWPRVLRLSGLQLVRYAVDALVCRHSDDLRANDIAQRRAHAG